MKTRAPAIVTMENIGPMMFIIVPGYMHDFIYGQNQSLMTKEESLKYAKDNTQTMVSKEKREIIDWVNGHVELFKFACDYGFYAEDDLHSFFTYEYTAPISLASEHILSEEAEENGMHWQDLANATNTLNMEDVGRPEIALVFKTLIKIDSDKLWTVARQCIVKIREVQKRVFPLEDSYTRSLESVPEFMELFILDSLRDKKTSEQVKFVARANKHRDLCEEEREIFDWINDNETTFDYAYNKGFYVMSRFGFC